MEVELPDLVIYTLYSDPPDGVMFSTDSLIQIELTTPDPNKVCIQGLSYGVTINGGTVDANTKPLMIKSQDDTVINFAFYSEDFDLIGDNLVVIQTNLPYTPVVQNSDYRRLQTNPYADNPYADQLILRVLDPCENPETFIAAESQSDLVGNPFQYNGSVSLDGIGFEITPTVCEPRVSIACSVSNSPVGASDICSAATFDTMTGAFSFDETDKAAYPPGSYVIDFVGTLGSKSATVQKTITIEDPCPTASLSLANSALFSASSSYTLGDQQLSLPWSKVNLLLKDTATDCGQAEFKFLYSSNDQDFDSAIFSDTRSSPSSNEFRVP